ncbi:uncharacterized protein LOC120685066 [Panicum virgatum]|uniref:uncharacterized protein LOC120685066 n=1 Tax=Panicum virgatum TaxID=38727 RepID=UPI0019D59E16|nr:uncharacterized protein LOC120685066 [Panicum virgatum]
MNDGRRTPATTLSSSSARRSVCSSWRAAYTSLCSAGSCRLRQTPCLLYTSESTDAREAGLYSIAEKKAYTLTLPDPPIRSRYIIGSSYGWIITAGERSELHLVNPITSEQISLPSVTTIEQVKPVFDDEGAVCSYENWCYTGEDVISDTPSVFPLSKLRDYLFYKAFLSPDPSTGGYFVVLIHNPVSQLSFARAGDDKWTWLPPHCYYEDCLFKEGLLYASTTFAEIHTFNLGAPAVTQMVFLDKMKDIYCERIYIVHGSSGEMLQIWRSDAVPRGEDEDETDSDLELELDRDKYVSNTSAITLKANHVYFTDDDYIYTKGFKNNRRDIGNVASRPDSAVRRDRSAPCAIPQVRITPRKTDSAPARTMRASSNNSTGPSKTDSSHVQTQLNEKNKKLVTDSTSSSTPGRRHRGRRRQIGGRGAAA